MGGEDCKICENKPAKYVCPRCNILYCSVDCYKSQRHLECSEGFFRENVVQELALRQSEDEAAMSSNTMLEILRRVEQTDPLDEENLSDASEGDLAGTDADSDDDDEQTELAARLSGVNLDDASSVWERLTGAEKEEFQSLVENGAIIKLLPSLNCWWTQEYKVDLIQAADGPSEQEKKLLSSCPKVWDKIPNFKDLFGKEPSSSVRFNIANVLAAYSFVYRYFHGDIHENALEAADCLISIALNLKKNAVFDSEPMAVESVTKECMQEMLPTDSTTTSVLKDHVRTFMMGPKACGKKFCKLFLLAALSDTRSLFGRANRELKELNEQKTIDKGHDIDISDLKHIDSTLIRSCLKKVEFFLAYVRSDFFSQVPQQ